MGAPGKDRGRAGESPSAGDQGTGMQQAMGTAKNSASFPICPLSGSKSLSPWGNGGQPLFSLGHWEREQAKSTYFCSQRSTARGVRRTLDSAELCGHQERSRKLSPVQTHHRYRQSRLPGEQGRNTQKVSRAQGCLRVSLDQEDEETPNSTRSRAPRGKCTTGEGQERGKRPLSNAGICR